MKITRATAAVAALSLVGLLAGCGGGGGGGESPQTVLDSASFAVTSGKAQLDLSAKVSGDQSTSLRIVGNGPFQKAGKGGFDSDITGSLKLEGGGRNVSGDGSVKTQNGKLFISYQGADYELGAADSLVGPVATYKRLGQGAAQGHLSSLFTNLKNDGDESVGSEETTHVSADFNVKKFTDYAKAHLQEVLGDTLKKLGPGGQAGVQAVGAQLDQAAQAVKKAHVDLYIGKSDKLVRKVQTSLTLEAPSSGAVAGLSSGEFGSALTLTEVNQPQTVTAPKNPQSVKDLLDKLGLGTLLGAAGAGGGGAGAAPPSNGTGGGGGTGTPPSDGAGAGGAPGGGPDAATRQKYLDCLKKAKDPASCSSILQ